MDTVVENVVDTTRHWGLLIDGGWGEAAGGERVEVITPVDRNQVSAPRALEADPPTTSR